MAQQLATEKTPQIPAQELVRQVIANENTASKERVRYMYRLRTETKNGSTTKEMVETNDGVVGRLIAVNDKPPSPEDRKRDDDKLRRLVNDPQARTAKQKSQKEDEERTEKMVKALPDAFLYEYDGFEQGKNGQELIRLKFKPNPKYDPPSRDLQVYQGMEGTMLIEPRQHRLARIQAHLFKGVNFGWGILGHLDPGGQFTVEQSNIGADRWEVTEMRLRFTGKVLLFKGLNINEHETAFDYRHAPDNLTFAQGVEFLKKQPEFLAEGTAGVGAKATE